MKARKTAKKRVEQAKEDSLVYPKLKLGKGQDFKVKWNRYHGWQEYINAAQLLKHISWERAVDRSDWAEAQATRDYDQEQIRVLENKLRLAEAALASAAARKYAKRSKR